MINFILVKKELKDLELPEIYKQQKQYKEWESRSISLEFESTETIKKEGFKMFIEYIENKEKTMAIPEKGNFKYFITDEKVSLVEKNVSSNVFLSLMKDIYNSDDVIATLKLLKDTSSILVSDTILFKYKLPNYTFVQGYLFSFFSSLNEEENIDRRFIFD